MKKFNIDVYNVTGNWFDVYMVVAADALEAYMACAERLDDETPEGRDGWAILGVTEVHD